MTHKPLTPDPRRPYTAEIGMDALVKRADGSTINFGDAIYHPENADEARAYAARVAAPSDGLRERIEALPWNPWRDEDEPLGPDERSWGAGVEWYVGEYRAAVLAELDRAALAAIPTDD
jgi:hypothetical protein